MSEMSLDVCLVEKDNHLQKAVDYYRALNRAFSIKMEQMRVQLSELSKTCSLENETVSDCKEVFSNILSKKDKQISELLQESEAHGKITIDQHIKIQKLKGMIEVNNNELAKAKETIEDLEQSGKDKDELVSDQEASIEKLRQQLAVEKDIRSKLESVNDKQSQIIGQQSDQITSLTDKADYLEFSLDQNATELYAFRLLFLGNNSRTNLVKDSVEVTKSVKRRLNKSYFKKLKNLVKFKTEPIENVVIKDENKVKTSDSKQNRVKTALGAIFKSRRQTFDKIIVSEDSLPSGSNTSSANIQYVSSL